MKRVCFLILSVTMILSCDNKGLIYQEAKPAKGFNFPYYLLVPENNSKSDITHLVVETNNSGFVSDNFNEHKKSAKKLITNHENMGVYISKELNYPMLMPIFPRTKSDWKVYTHALDRDVIEQKDNDLERIDLQLIKMIQDADSTLRELGFKIKEEIILTGFSASGTFANRFTIIHPNKVELAVAGGLNGILPLPINSIKNEKLNYPIGTNDFQKLFEKAFDSTAFKSTPQFLFMGRKDDNDAIQYADAYNENERDLIYTVIAKDMHERWDICRKIYHNKRINAVIKSYDELGHGYDENVKQEILAFIRLHLNK